MASRKCLQAAELKLIDILRRRPKDLTSALLGNTAFALSTLHYISEELMDRIASLTTDIVHKMEMRDMLNVAIAFARLGCQAEQHFVDSFNQHIMSHVCLSLLLLCFPNWMTPLISPRRLLSYKRMKHYQTIAPLSTYRWCLYWSLEVNNMHYKTLRALLDLSKLLPVV